MRPAGRSQSLGPAPHTASWRPAGMPCTAGFPASRATWGQRRTSRPSRPEESHAFPAPRVPPAAHRPYRPARLPSGPVPLPGRRGRRPGRRALRPHPRGQAGLLPGRIRHPARDRRRRRPHGPGHPPRQAGEGGPDPRGRGPHLQHRDRLGPGPHPGGPGHRTEALPGLRGLRPGDAGGGRAETDRRRHGERTGRGLRRLPGPEGQAPGRGGRGRPGREGRHRAAHPRTQGRAGGERLHLRLGRLRPRRQDLHHHRRPEPGPDDRPHRRQPGGAGTWSSTSGPRPRPCPWGTPSRRSRACQ